MATSSLNSSAETQVLLTTSEASVILRVSRWKLYDLIHRRRLDTIKIGRRRFVPRDALMKLIGELREEIA